MPLRPDSPFCPATPWPCAVAWLLAVFLALSLRPARAESEVTVGGSQYSPLKEINARNVSRLIQAWIHVPDLPSEELHALPVADGGLLAYCSAGGRVWVLDGATGRLRWHARTAEIPDPAAEAGATANTLSLLPATAAGGDDCHGVALHDGSLYLAAADGRVLAWNALTGMLRWQMRAVPRDGSSGVLQGPPVLAGGTVVVGSSVVRARQRGLLLGLDMRTGRELWRDEVVAGAANHWGVSGERAGERAFGGSAGVPGSWDAAQQMLYWGTGSPLPLFDWAGADYKTHGSHPGDNAYTGSLLALDPSNGRLLAWHQEIAHEVWVRDSAASEVLLLSRGGQNYVVHPNRSGLVFVYTAALRLVRVWQAARNFNLAGSVDTATGVLGARRDFNAGQQTNLCPALEGAFPGLSGSYSPQTGLWYKVVAEWCMDVQVDRSAAPAPAAPGSGADLRELLGGIATATAPQDERARAHLDARDPLTGAKMWTVEFPEPPLASLLSTAGRLLWVADARGTLHALDAGTGRTLWRHQDDEGHAGGLISYEAGGHQYLAVVTGWDGQQHPAFARVFGGRFAQTHTPKASLRVFRLP